MRTSQVQRHTNLSSIKHMLSCFRRLDLELNLARLASPRPLGAPQLRPAVQRPAAMHTRSIQARARA